MGTTFDQDDVFPVIARLIESLHAQHGGFVRSNDLAAALLQDEEGRRAIEEAQRRQDEVKPLEWIASNMVAWFGQRITADASSWSEKFEREKIDDRWAYKLAIQR